MRYSPAMSARSFKFSSLMARDLRPSGKTATFFLQNAKHSLPSQMTDALSVTLKPLFPDVHNDIVKESQQLFFILW